MKYESIVRLRNVSYCWFVQPDQKWINYVLVFLVLRSWDNPYFTNFLVNLNLTVIGLKPPGVVGSKKRVKNYLMRTSKKKITSVSFANKASSRYALTQMPSNSGKSIITPIMLTFWLSGIKFAAIPENAIHRKVGWASILFIELLGYSSVSKGWNQPFGFKRLKRM